MKVDEATLNPRQGERAVLIKNSGGDWGIVIGRWEGMKKGVAGTRRKCPLHIVAQGIKIIKYSFGVC